MKHRVSLLAFVFFLLLATEKAAAQLELGASLGSSSNWLTTSSAYHYDRYYAARNGFSAAIPVRYRIQNWFALQAEVAYTQKNYEWHRSGVVDSEYNQSYCNSYLQLPLLANFSFGGRSLRGFLNLGGYIGAWVYSQTKGSFPFDSQSRYHFAEPVSFHAQRDNQFEAGLLGGIGLEYRINSDVSIFAEGRYQYSLTDMQKRYMIVQVPRYNNTFTLQAGILLRIGK